jgi:hypothetical protein
LQDERRRQDRHLPGEPCARPGRKVSSHGYPLGAGAFKILAVFTGFRDYHQKMPIPILPTALVVNVANVP